MVPDCIGQIVQRHTDVCEAVPHKQLYAVLDHGLVEQRDHWLWHRTGKRPQTLSCAARHDDSFHKQKYRLSVELRY